MQNVIYIMDSSGADVIVNPVASGINDGLLFVITHAQFRAVKNAEYLIYRLLEKVSWLISLNLFLFR